MAPVDPRRNQETAPLQSLPEKAPVVFRKLQGLERGVGFVRHVQGAKARDGGHVPAPLVEADGGDPGLGNSCRHESLEALLGLGAFLKQSRDDAWHGILPLGSCVNEVALGPVPALGH